MYIKNEEVKIKVVKWKILKYLSVAEKGALLLMKGSSSEEEGIGICKCRRKSQHEIMNEEMKL